MTTNDPPMNEIKGNYVKVKNRVKIIGSIVPLSEIDLNDLCVNILNGICEIRAKYET